MATIVASQHFGPMYFLAVSSSEQSSDKWQMMKLFDPLSQDLGKIPYFFFLSDLSCCSEVLWTQHHGIKKEEEAASSRNSSGTASRRTRREVLVRVKAFLLSAPIQDPHSLTLGSFWALEAHLGSTLPQGKEIVSVNLTFSGPCLSSKENHRTQASFQRLAVAISSTNGPYLACSLLVPESGISSLELGQFHCMWHSVLSRVAGLDVQSKMTIIFHRV